MPTGEISAGAGIGTDGGSFEASISENNWLGEGKRLDFNIWYEPETAQIIRVSYSRMGNWEYKLKHFE